MSNLTLSKKSIASYLGISRSSLYYKNKLPNKDKLALKQIKKVMLKHPSYGHRRIAIELCMNKKRVKRIMKKYNLRPKLKRRKPRMNRGIRMQGNKYSNIASTICPIAPNVIWSSDFTYIRYKGIFIYLATVIDVFSKVIVGQNISIRHDTELVKRALIDACKKEIDIPEIFHTDQGSEYESSEMIELLEDLGITISRSDKSSPWQNGCQEAFFSNFKLDLGDVNRFKSIKELIKGIKKTINYYNNERIHLNFKLPPRRFLSKYLMDYNDLTTKSLS